MWFLLSVTVFLACGFLGWGFKRRVAPIRQERCLGQDRCVGGRRGSTALAATKGGVKGKVNCKLCGGTGGVDCIPCRGLGVDKVKGDIFQRFMCKTCSGFGKVGCSCTGGRGLTPEQTGER